jgi:aryl-alcohol dehydrogenase-like predicted oxidoreductase
MNHRTLGPFKCSVIGLGTGTLASLARGLTDKERGRLLDAADASAINLIDTADSYAQGECERYLGHALQGRRDRFILCTKAGFTFASVGGIARLVRPLAKKAVSYLRAGRQLVTQARAVAMRASVRSQDFSNLGACAEASLQRLRTDHLDVFFLHNPPVEVLRDPNTASAAQRLIREGKTRLFGVSSDEAAVLEVAIGMPEVSVVQMPVHPCLDAPARQVLRKCADQGRAVIANQVLSTTMLAPPSDANQYVQSRAVLQAVAAQHRCSVQRLLLGFAASQAGVACVLTGTTRPDHLRSNVADINAPVVMRDADVAAIRAALAS